MNTADGIRVLLVASPSTGHVFPMVPLAWALRSAGHEVLVATAGTSLAVERAGLPVVDVAPGWDTGRIMRHMVPEFVAMVEQRARTGPRRAFSDLRQPGPFASVSDFLADAVVAVARQWRPDLVISSQIDGAGMVTAGVLGVPLVVHGFGFARSGGLAEAYHVAMAGAFERHGITAPPLPAATIDIAPPSMTGGEIEGWSMRGVPFNGSGRVPDWLRTAPDRPRIAVTLGTVSPTTNGLGPIRRIVDAAAGLDVELVLALGDGVDVSTLGGLPPYARVAGWVPLNVLLPSCAAIVHHGGAGTTLAALDAGVPQLVLPDGGDRFVNADAVMARGAGRCSEADLVDAGLLDLILHDPDLRTACEQVRAEMRAMPSPASLVPDLVDLAGADHPATVRFPQISTMN